MASAFQICGAPWLAQWEDKMGDQPKRWHHRPTHVFVPNTIYMVTCGTLHKAHFFRGDDRLALLQDALFEVAEAYG
jgi:hypothetical protein